MAVVMPLMMSLIYWQPHLLVASSNTVQEGNDQKYLYCIHTVNYTEWDWGKGACYRTDTWATEIITVIGAFVGSFRKEDEDWVGSEEWAT